MMEPAHLLLVLLLFGIIRIAITAIEIMAEDRNEIERLRKLLETTGAE